MKSPDDSTAGKQTDHRDELIARLRGQSVVIPDLDYIYKDCNPRTNPEIDELSSFVEDWIERYIPTPAERARQRKVNVALCCAYFWTHGSMDKLLVLTSFVAWLFFWDDEIDCGTLTNDSARTDAYCDATLAFMKHHLQPELNVTPPPAGRLHNSGMWAGIGKEMQVGQSKESRDRFAESVYRVVNAVRDTQAKWVIGMDSYDDYAKRRRAGVALDIVVTSLQWFHGLSLPASIWEHEAMQSVMDEVSITVFLFNDIVSLKKEVVDGQVDSTVPIYVWSQNSSPQAAVDKAVKMLEVSWGNLLAAGSRLQDVADTEQDKREVKVVVDSCKEILVGHMAYCLRSARYMTDATFEGQGNAFRVVL
ncbi:isoprenoid synthase domain-containing protein [Paraphoma chrysanthemicola]|nr:isoprenoid synthase domain-containing protein [Paraphoma chrysanthemicola]